MRIRAFASFVFTALAVAALAVPPSYAGGWGWDRDAGAKARGEFGGAAAQNRTSTGHREGLGRNFHQTRLESRAGVACPQPAGSSFKAGDRVAVATGNSELRVGADLLGIIPQGTEFAVLQVEGPWLGASVMIGGQTKSGWVEAGAVSASRPMHKANAETDTATLGRRLPAVSRQVVAPRSAGETGNDCQIERRKGTIGPYDRDPYGLRDYDPSVPLVPSHEWDPNIHQWQPWLSR